MSVIRCYITDRRMLGGVGPLLINIERQIIACVDWIQLREKDLSARELLDLARRAVALGKDRGGRTRILINSRLDVAVAAGAHGVHLPSGSIAASQYKRIAPSMMVGVSCHNRAELVAAEREGADYVMLSPVFRPLSKKAQGETLSLAEFAELAGAVRIPVIALGGIIEAGIPACERAGAAGVAGISLFQRQVIE